MLQPVFIIDAFTDTVFGGNPAAVCPLETWLPDELMQRIAAEYVLSETAFFVPEGDGFRIRWFTPSVEVQLCGHATLSSGHVLFNHLGYTGDRIKFDSLSGLLSVERNGDMLYLDFPARPGEVCPVPPAMIEGLGEEPVEVLAAQYYLAVFEKEDTIREMSPDFSLLNTLDRPVIVTAPGDECDFVSRFFAPGYGIDEDPVTGSSHTTLIPYWSERLNRQEMTALQVSARGGTLFCRNEGDRVKIGGKSVTYLRGEITV